MVILQCLQHFSVNCTVYFSLTLILDLHMTFFCGFLCLIQDAVERKCVIGRKMHCRRCHFTQPLHKLYIGIWVSVLFPFSGTSKELTFIMKIIMKNGEHCFHVDKVYKLTFWIPCSFISCPWDDTLWTKVCHFTYFSPLCVILRGKYEWNGWHLRTDSPPRFLCIFLHFLWVSGIVAYICEKRYIRIRAWQQKHHPLQFCGIGHWIAFPRDW